MKKYRKIPVVIEAIQLLNTSASIRAATTFINGKEPETSSAIASGKWDDYVNICNEKGGIYLKTLESDDSVQKADFGDYIIKGVKGEVYPCKPDVFKLTYEEVAP